jgi:two-component system, NtrC family, C4-dicarboxylate transport response regulator DctD
MAPDKPPRTIMIVDDNRDIREFARRFLEAAGYDAITAVDGEQGLRLYQQQRAGIVLLLTDVVMPNMGGLELVDRVLEIDSQLPVLLMSGDDWSPYRGLDCLAKPFAPANLIDKVRRALNAKTRSATATPRV